MSIVVTTELWKAASSAKHKGKYDYSLSEYVHGKGLVKIICPDHGVFLQAAGVHKGGAGCTECARLRSGGTQRLTLDQFVDNANKIWNGLYDYSLVDYKCSTKKVEIVCKEHGSFHMLPSNHVKKSGSQGCPECAKWARAKSCAKTHEEFLQQAKSVHWDKYNYEKSVYLGDKVKLIIGCPKHKDFTQVPSNHLQGQGCPCCKKGGFQVSKPAHLYVLSDGEVTKVGITNRSVTTRLKEVKRTGGPELSIKSSYWFEDGSIPLSLESHVHSYLRSKYKPVTDLFSGSTECFLDVNLEELLTFITPLAAQTEANNRPTN